MGKDRINDYDIAGKSRIIAWRADWCLFAKEVFGVELDEDQKSILRSVQKNKMTSVASGVARGKDFVAAVVSLCFLYLTPRWNKKGELTHNTKVILSAPTSRQVENIMTPEFTRLFLRAKSRGVELPGRLVGNDIRTDLKEWFLSGFKSDDNSMENWSGLHAANILFCLTEATGISDTIFAAIEGNLQGDFSRILLVFNPNSSTGYAAASQKSPRWAKFRLNSMNAPNVLAKKIIIPGQVDYDWIQDKVQTWSQPINEADFNEGEADFEWEGKFYRPNDTFRIKVLGMFPKVSSDVLVPLHWIELAQERWKEHHERNRKIDGPLRLGVDVAGMGRDSSAFCFRYGDYVEKFELIQSGGEANHMHIAGLTKSILESNTNEFRGTYAQAFIDTIGEGAGVYSRLSEQGAKVHSCKFSSAAKDGGNDLHDLTRQKKFLNMRAYAYWAIRDWLDPSSKSGAMLPPDVDLLAQELTETKWWFRSDAKVQIEEKEEIRKRIGRSPDLADALANTFWPIQDYDPRKTSNQTKKLATLFH